MTTDRWCLVTGAANGLGRDIALGLLADGWHVAALDTDADGLASLSTEASGRLTPITADVRDRSAVRDAVDRIAAAGPIVGLINNAGIISVGSVLEMSDADWCDVMDVNVTGAFYVAQAVAARMTKDAIPGRIVNLGSITGKVPRLGRASYSVSKAAVAMLTRCLALELAPAHITVNTVSPGSAEGGVVWQNIAQGHTTMAALIEGDLSRYRLGVPLGRLATSADVLDAIRFLLSPGAAHITGDELRVDGGQGMF